MPRLADYAVDQISRIADTKLHTTANHYKMGLSAPGAVTIDKTSLKIELQGVVPQGLEKGWPAFDMKPRMLASRSAKTTKSGGRYVDVPFRHALEQNASHYQGMPPDVKRTVQAAIRAERKAAKAEGRPERDVTRVTGRSRGVLRQQHRLNVDGTTTKVSYKTKVGIHDDMMRIKMLVGQRKMSEYRTFRRISSNSSAKQWWHPGFRGVHAIPAVRASMKLILEALMRDALRKHGVKGARVR